MFTNSVAAIDCPCSNLRTYFVVVVGLDFATVIPPYLSRTCYSAIVSAEVTMQHSILRTYSIKLAVKAAIELLAVA